MTDCCAFSTGDGHVFTQGDESMFDSLEERMKAEELEGTPKERMTRYIAIAAVSIVVIGAIILATEFLK
jgi:hypothetical protein